MRGLVGTGPAEGLLGWQEHATHQPNFIYETTAHCKLLSLLDMSFKEWANLSKPNLALRGDAQLSQSPALIG